ncbi:MAG: hypothetical protein KatS3mg105_2641 [Gemmatales bacterium]|nr:MAG: hypothetical protein KatS3mg105_2641 [Gemmatales bacterium]
MVLDATWKPETKGKQGNTRRRTPTPDQAWRSTCRPGVSAWGVPLTELDHKFDLWLILLKPKDKLRLRLTVAGIAIINELSSTTKSARNVPIVRRLRS